MKMDKDMKIKDMEIKDKDKEINSKSKIKNKKYKFEQEYVPENENQVGLLIGKKRSNLINLNIKCKDMFNSHVFIMINNKENDKTSLIIKSNSQEVIEFVIDEFKVLDRVKEKFNNSYNFENTNSLNSKELMNLIINKAQISLENYKIWISDDLKFGYIYLRNIEDYDKLKLLNSDILFKNVKNTKIKYDFNVNIKFRSIGEDIPDIKKKAYRILLDELIIVIGKNKFKIFINKDGNFGKIYIKENEDIQNVLLNINKLSIDGIEFIAYEYIKDKTRLIKSERNNFSHSLVVRNISNYISVYEINTIIDRFVENKYKVLMKMREDDSDLNKGFCKILLQNEEDCINLLNSLSNQGFHGTIWDVSIGQSK